jgi:hypothetical protein
MALLAPAQDARASHSRNHDAWTDIWPNGVVTLNVTTRWSKGSIGDPTEGSGVDPSRFGVSQFHCEATGDLITVSPPAGMHIVRVSDGSTVYTWPPDSFSLSATTVDIDTSSPFHDARSQILVIPLGSTAAANQIVSPLNLAPGDYDIRWNDWSRVRGLQNLDPTDECGGLDDGYGFNVRFRWDGTANHGPSLAPVNATVNRGLPYEQNVNAMDPDAVDTLLYTFAPLNPFYPDFGPQTQVPGLTLDSLSGMMTIPASATAGLLDNHFAEPAADYLVKVRIRDSRGAVSEREILLDVVDASGEAAADASLRVSTSATGPSLQLSWTPACNATDHTVYWGTGPIVGGLRWTGAACALGKTGTALFDPGAPPLGRFIYFAVVGRTSLSEGSYGRSSAGVEQPEAVGVGACDIPQVAGLICP